MENNQLTFFRSLETNSSAYTNLVEQVNEQSVWPKYLLQDRNNLKYWDKLYEVFPLYQFFLLEENRVVGSGNCVPLYLTPKEKESLPDEGWDWAIAKAFADFEQELKPNALCALQISVDPAYQGKGVSKYLIDYMKGIAVENNFSDFILPIRPTLKHRYPLQQMDSYMQWINNRGLPYDAWIRSHVRNGATIVKVCNKAMVVEGTVLEWEAWTNLTFQTSGEYILPLALNPMKIDMALNKGIYIEPNVWMRYAL